MSALLLLLVVFAIVYFIGKSTKNIRRQPIVRFNSGKHFTVVIGYVVFLLVVLVTAEIIGQLHQSFPSSDAITTAQLTYTPSIDDVDETMNASRLIEKRTHPAGDILNIQNDYGGADLYIERKSTNDDLIEEWIFKPTLLVNQYDFSDKINVMKPIWQDNLITIPEQPVTEFRYGRFFDNALLSQMTQAKFPNSSSHSFSTRLPIIYLLVPESIKIEASSKSSIQFVED